MAVIGIGTTSRVTVEDVLAIIGHAKQKLRHREAASATVAIHESNDELDPGLLRVARSHGEQLRVLAALDRPAINAVLEDAARLASLDAVFIPLDGLAAAAPFCVTHSEKSMKTYGIPSVAEAAALAAAGPQARLLIPRFCGPNTTAGVAA